MKSYLPASCPYRACKPSVVVNATNTDRERESPNLWRNRVFIYFILFALKLFFMLLSSVWFSSSFRMVKMLKLELYSDKWVKLGYKWGSKPPTETAGLGDADNLSLNLKSSPKKETGKKKFDHVFCWCDLTKLGCGGYTWGKRVN